MLLTVLPFFLAAKVLIDEEGLPGHRESARWSHGPEFTYEVFVNISVVSAKNRTTDGICSIMRTDLKCRPAGEDTLSCRFDQPRRRSPAEDPSLTGCKWSFIGRSDRFVGLGNFELRFNPRGVENLVVSRNIPRHKLDIIKAVANQFNTGLDLLQPRQNFSATENGTGGRCEVLGRVALVPTIKPNRTFHGFDLQFEPPRTTVNLTDQVALEIQKLRNPKKCPRKPVYLFGQNHQHPVNTNANQSVFMQMVYSISRMTISKNSFSSYTTSEGIVKSPEGDVMALAFQTIRLTLKSVKPAREEIAEIYQAASTGLHTYSTLDYSSSLVSRINRK